MARLAKGSGAVDDRGGREPLAASYQLPANLLAMAAIVRW
jgi:hypothetical protein